MATNSHVRLLSLAAMFESARYARLCEDEERQPGCITYEFAAFMRDEFALLRRQLCHNPDKPLRETILGNLKPEDICVVNTIPDAEEVISKLAVILIEKFKATTQEETADAVILEVQNSLRQPSRLER